MGSFFKKISKQDEDKSDLTSADHTYRKILDNTSDSIFILQNLKIVYVNPELIRVSGYTWEELMGRHFLKFVARDEVRRIKEYQKKRYRGEEAPSRYESRAQLRNGGEIDVEVSIIPITFGGEPADQVILRDITKMKIAQEKLQQSEENFRLLFNNSFDGIFINDDEGNYLYANKRAAQISGYTIDELTRMNARDLTPPDLSHILKDRMNDQFSEGLALKGQDFLLLHKDGHKIPVEVNGSITSWQGNKAQIVSIRDITDRKKAEYRLKESERKFREFAELMPEIVFEIDHNLNLIFTNKTAETKLGYDLVDFQEGKASILDLIIPEEKDRFVKSITSNLSGIRSSGNKYRFISANGKEFKFQVYNSIVADNNQIKGLRGILIDITEQEKLLDEIKEARKKAEESDHLKTAFLANMSHEIRTPMNSILGFTELLDDTGLTSETKEKYLSIIKKSGKRMLETVNDIIDISKIETGQVKVSLNKTNINELLEQNYLSFLPEIREKGINFKRTAPLDDEIAFIYSDEFKLNSIFINLIKNAIKFTEQGDIEIGYLIPEGHHQEAHVFYVRDTGDGIPKDRQTAIFNRFEQADIEDKKAKEGSGLGLAICKSYVEMLGGKIWLNSVEKEGTTFFFSVSDMRETYEEDHASRLSSYSVQNESETSTKIPSLKILIAEDDETSFIHLSILLKPYTKEIIRASSGPEVHSLLEKHPDVDLILMDIKLPGEDGYTVTQKIREKGNQLPIIAQTAYALEGERERAIDSGCNDYISKPISEQALFSAIRRCTKYCCLPEEKAKP